MLVNPFESLDSKALEQNLLKLAAAERDVNADIILHLLVVKERRLYAPAGYDSLFSYCTGRLGFSRSTAYRRKAVVDRAEAFPDLIRRLREGRLHLCAAAAVAPHLEASTAAELLDAVEGLSHREVEAFLVKTWQAKSAAAKPAGSSNAGTELKFGLALVPSQSATPVAKAEQRTIVKPVSADKSRVSVTLSDKTLENLQRAKELLGGKTDDEILQRALERLLDQIAPERRHERREARNRRQAKKPAGKVPSKKSPTKASRASRRGSISVRDQTMVSGGGRCSFVAADGTRCMSRTFLEVDHVRPWAHGGPSTLDNQRPLCRTHNAHFSELTFGPWNGERSVGELS